ncbi:MAG: hypothetical protein LBK04_01190 [Clostridiales Family XIII bacterium]|jgi:hypothetical protein|nr:hypothetical protein [Clostridiales Family XIII bacterium]
MLSKLIKYEFRATAKIILLSWAALFVIAVINYFAMPWTDTGSSLGASLALGDAIGAVKGTMQGILFFTYVLSAVAVAAMSFVLMVIRYYKLLGDEGYLMFTLPVTASQHIISKLITSVVWNVSSLLLVGLSVFIVIGRFDVLRAIPEYWRSAVEQGLQPGLWVFCTVVFVFVYAVSGMLQFYTAISIGSHITRSRIGGSIIGYIIVYIGSQIINGIGALILIMPMSSETYIYPTYISSSAGMGSTAGMVNSIVLSYFITFILVGLAIAIPCYFISHYMISKKLNLH